MSLPPWQSQFSTLFSQWMQTTIFWTRTLNEMSTVRLIRTQYQADIWPAATKSFNWCGSSLNTTMFHYAYDFNINGGTFTIVNEQNGMTSALYEYLVNWYSLTAFYANVSRYYIDGSRMAPFMILLNMYLYVTQIPTRLLLVTSWAGLKTPLACPVSCGSMAQWGQAWQQLPSHSANDVWLHSGLQEASSFCNMPLDRVMPNFYSPWFLSGFPLPSLMLEKSLMRLLPRTHLSQWRHLRYSCGSWFLNHCNKVWRNLWNQ